MSSSGSSIRATAQEWENTSDRCGPNRSKRTTSGRFPGRERRTADNAFGGVAGGLYRDFEFLVEAGGFAGQAGSHAASRNPQSPFEQGVRFRIGQCDEAFPVKEDAGDVRCLEGGRHAHHLAGVDMSGEMPRCQEPRSDRMEMRHVFGSRRIFRSAVLEDEIQFVLA